MTEKEYEEKIRYHTFHLIAYPMLILVGIYIVGILIESFMGVELGIAKKIFMGVGGIGYFIFYFKEKMYKMKK